MADLKRTIEILFHGTNQVGPAVAGVGRDLRGLNSSITSVAQPFADFTGMVAKLETALAALAAVGMYKAFNESSKLQTAFTELKKVAGDNVEVMAAAKQHARDMSNEYGVAASEVLLSTANYVQAGFSVQEAMGLTKTGMDLVIAGGVEAAESSEILVSALKGFKAPASEAGRLLDILNEVSNNYATDVEQLGNGMAKLSPIASKMGFSMEETAGILTPVIEVFRSGDEAAVALKTGLLRLVDDSVPVKKALESIGVSQHGANGELRSGKDILFDVSKAFQTLDQDQKLYITQQLVGINQSARMVEVFDGLGKSAGITAKAMVAAGSAAGEVAKRLKDPEVALNRLRESFNNFSSAVGDEFQKGSVEALDGIKDMFNAMEKAVQGGAFKPVLEALDNFLVSTGDYFQKVAKALPEALEGIDFSGFMDALSDLARELGGVFDNLDLTTPEGLRSAIQDVVDLFEKMARFAKGATEVLGPLIKKAGSLANKLNDLDGDVFEVVGNIGGIATAITTLSGVFDRAMGFIEGLGQKLGLISTKSAPAVRGAVSGMSGAVEDFSKTFIDRFLKATTGVDSFSTKLRAVGQVAAAALGGYYLNKYWDDIKGKVNDSTQSLIGFGEKLLFGTNNEIRNQAVQEKSIEIQQRWKQIMQERSTTMETATIHDKDYWLAQVNSMDKSYNATEKLREKMRELGILVEEPKVVNVDTKQAEANLQRLEYWRESTGTWETIMVPIDTQDIEKAKKAIDEIPAVKRFELETDLNIAKLESDAKIVQTALEWKAKLEIAQAEAALGRLKAVAESVSSAVASTGDTLSSLFSSYTSADSYKERNTLETAISREQTRREDALKIQQDLAKSEIALNKARQKRLNKKDALITVEGDGLEPHLEMIMWELFKAIQIRASQEGVDQLLLGGS